MKRKELHIAEPCAADWDGMTGDDRKRYCLQCTKHVHNVSELTETEAKELLTENDNLGVQYAFNREGEILFSDTPDPTWRLFRQVEGLKRLVAAAAIAMPLALGAGCDPNSAASTTEPVADSPIVIEVGGVKLQEQNQGAGRSVEFKPSKPEVVAEPEIEVLQGEPEIAEPELVMGQAVAKPDPDKFEHVKGKVAIDPDPEPEIEVMRGDVAFEPETHTEDTTHQNGSEDGEGANCDGESEGQKTETPKEVSHEPDKSIRHVKGRMAPKTNHDDDAAHIVEW